MTKEQIGKTALIVEDDISILKMVVDKLTIEGFTVLQARDGEEGFMVACVKNPDIILTDIMMPKMDGLSMMKKLRSKNKWGKNVPIILLTNLSPDDEKINKSVTEDLPTLYIMKPDWDIDDMVAEIKEKLNVV